jgi:subtilisin-like proprotein convertase family protein
MDTTTTRRTVDRFAGLLLAALLLMPGLRGLAQTTISTTYTTPANGIGNANAYITFVVENTNATPIELTAVGALISTTYVPSGTTTFTLWASTACVSGSPINNPAAPGCSAAGIATPIWTQVATSAPVAITSAVLTLVPAVSGFSYVIPASTSVRFALQSTGGIFYAGTAGTPASPNQFSGGGVNLRTGNATIGGLNVGFGGGFPTGNFGPRFFAGSITVQPLSPCSGTPNPGATTANVEGACVGQSFTVGLQNTTTGTGVTYAWEFDNGLGWTAFGTSAPTQSVTQSVNTSYRCTVTCTEPGGGSQTSTPIAVPMATPFPVTFTQTVFPSNCWASSGTGATFLSRQAPNGFGVPGTGSARFNFYDAPSGQTLILTSPVFAPLPAARQITFHAAGATFSTEVDQIFLESSSNGGTTWNPVVTLTNANPGGDLNTGGASTALFVPNASQWRSLSYPVPAGTDRIRFRGVSAFGNAVYLDNIQIEEVLACDTPTGITASPTGATTATVGWTTTLASSYLVELRTSGAPGSGPTGLAVSGTVATPPFNATGLVTGTTYIVYVRGDCGVDGLSNWSAPTTLSIAYCAAGGANTNPANIPTVTNVTIAGINQNNTSPNAYLDFTAAVGNVAPGGTYPFSFSRQVSYTLDQFLVWVDWNEDLDFNDPGEEVFVSAIGIGAGPFGGAISCPPGTSPGNKRMRIRRQYVDIPNGFLPNNTPCGNSTFGQVLDFTLSVCSAASATSSVVENCGNDTFSITVDISASNGGGLTINWVAIPGGPGSVAATVGSNTIPVNFPSTTTVNVTVSNSTLCTLDLGAHFSNCPITLDCGNEIFITHCYSNNDPRTFHFINPNPGGTVDVQFINPSPIASGDGVNFFDGPPVTGTPISVPPFGADLSNIGVFTSPGEVFSITIDSDASGSCADGVTGGPWTLRVLCTPSCTPGDADIVGITTDCDAQTFTVEIDYFFLGEVFNTNTQQFDPATEGGIRYSIDGGSPVDVTGLQEGIYSFDFPLLASVDIWLLHETDGLCNTFLGTFTRNATCPPANNACANAVPLTIQPFGGCPAGGTPGSTFDANSTVAAPNCNGAVGPIRDVWYALNTGSALNPITVNVTPGSATHLSWEIWSVCAGPSLFCSGAASVPIIGFQPNTNYLIRVFTNQSLGQPGTFTICLSEAAPTPIAHATCAQNLAIPDNGCGANNFANGDFTITGAPGTVLGTDVALQSVELIVTHTWREDLRIFLRSPAGQEFQLINQRGGSADNFGNPAACPTQVLVLQDGGAPLSTMSTVTNNITGTFAPEQALSGFNTGDPNGQWRVRICDAFAGDVGLLNFIKLNFACIGVAATASNNGPVCAGEPVQLFANTAEGDVFSWSGPGGFSSTEQNPTVPSAVAGDYTCAVSSTLNPCPTVVTTTVVVNPTPAGVSSTGGFAICVGGSVPGGQGLTATTTDAIPGTASATYTAGNIPTNPLSYSATCNGPATPLVVNIPPGALVTGVNVSYAFEALPPPGDGWITEQRSRIACTETGLAENGPTAGFFTCANGGGTNCVNNSGVAVYTRSGLSIANGVSVSGTLTFEMQAFRTFMGIAGCNDQVNRINNNSWTVTVNYLTPATVNWYDAPTGGNLIGTGSPFDPVAANAVDANTAGVYILWAGTSVGGCESPRTAVPFFVGSEDVTLEFQTGNTPADLSWQLEDVQTNTVVWSGNGLTYPPTATFQQVRCLPPGRCYKLRVTDAGDGADGYQLRNTSGQQRLIDNSNNLGTGTSEITGNPYSFCLPVGTNAPIYTSCDKFFWRTGEYLVAAEDVDVSAVWIPNGPNNVQSANTGYEFWFFNPNGGYSFRRFRSHNQSDGFGNVGATRACHMRVNNWAVAQHIPEFDLHNVRIRARVNGVNKPWGPACRFVRNEALAQCPPTKLMDIPGNPFLSCNQFRQWNVPGSRIHARPVSGANLYQWRFRIPAENVEIIRTSTSYFLNLNWGPLVADPLQNGKTYEVDVRASRDGGITWCGLGGDPWGDVCLLTIGTPPMQGGGQNLALAGNELLNLWPNPNNGDELWISLSEVAQGVETIAVDIHDLFGKRVSAQVLATQGDHVYTVMTLPADMASGVYTVSILAGEQRFTQRLVIAR